MISLYHRRLFWSYKILINTATPIVEEGNTDNYYLMDLEEVVIFSFTKKILNLQ